jgi:sigma-B regulation protein RsbU (phosphoserine phosphatase)
MAVLLVHSNGNATGQVIPLTKPEMIIGRRQDCDVVLEPNGVSREHAKICREDQRHYVVDLHSRNRTKLNEVPVEPGQRHLLKAGDRINICDVELVYYPVYPPEPGAREAVEVFEAADDSTIHMLDASRSDLLASVVKPEVKLKAILDISRALSTSLKIDVVAPKILDALLEIFAQAERAFLVLLRQDEPGGKWTFRQTFHKVRPARRGGLRPTLGAAPDDEPRLRISRAIINHVVDNRKAVLSQDAGADMNLPTSASIADLKIRSILCVPMLTSDGQMLGIVQLDTSDRKQFNQEDLDVLEAVARQAAIALQNAQMHESLLAQERIRRDLGLAQTIQVRFLPRSVPSVPGFEFFAHYHAAYEVGGDYYDFVPLGDERWAIALGDVAGKGVAAALMMAKFAGDTRACVLTDREPSVAMTHANRVLCDAGIEERFITLGLCVLDCATRKVTYASAGHLPVMVRRADGRIEEFGADVSGFPLGIDAEGDYAQGEFTLEPGDVALVYSDGVTDARSQHEELYDSQKNRRLMKRVADTPGGASALGKALVQDLREFSAGHPQADDITLVCFGPKVE